MKKNFILLVCAVSPLLADKHNIAKAELNVSNTPSHQAVSLDVSASSQAVKYAKDIANVLNELKDAFGRWGINAIWDQVRGKSTHAFGAHSVSSVYGLFSDVKRPLTAVMGGKFISSNPAIDGKVADGDHIKAIQDALASSLDGQVVVSGKRLEANPVDKDGGMVEVSYQYVAWNNLAFGLKDNQFFVFVETQD